MTVRRLFRLTLLAGLGYAAWEYFKRAQAAEAPSTQQSAPMSAPSKPAAAAKPQPGPKSAPKPPAGAEAGSEEGSETSNDDDASKAELYEKATELGIEGRSKMSKAELERAIRDVG
jgi:DNA end-binding protein Ku